jgi:hypothetical protein
MSSNLDVTGYGHTGKVVEDDTGIFTGTITRDSDGVIVWEDGCDIFEEMVTWVLGAFSECARTGVMPTLYYGD